VDVIRVLRKAAGLPETREPEPVTEYDEDDDTRPKHRCYSKPGRPKKNKTA
jgi:hypothetical protein